MITSGKPTCNPPKSYINLANLQIYENKIKEILEREIKQTNQTNCPNCGAVITSYKCEYCGTIF